MWFAVAALVAMAARAAGLPASVARTLPVPTPGALPSVPQPRVIPSRVVVPAGVDTAVRLDADVRIPDGGVLNWPVSLPWGHSDADANVTGVSVTLRGVHHPDVRDLHVQLWHGGRGVTLTDGARAGTRFGTAHFPEERSPSLDDIAACLGDETSCAGRGADVVFEDVSSRQANLLAGAPAAQGSTLLGAGAERAVDGGVGGFFGAGSVAHTGHQVHGGTEAWWEGDVRPAGAAAGDKVVGTVRVWGRAVEPDRDEVQVVRVRSEAQLTGGTFRLRLTMGNLTAVTDDVSVFAVGPSADEREQGTVGARPGQSVQSALEAMQATALAPGAPPLSSGGADGTGLAGSVRVRRSPPDSFGGYAWTVTFATLAGEVPLLAPEAVSIGTTSSTAGVDVREVVRGSSSAFYNYPSPTGIVQERVAGTFAPAWVMLLSRPMGDVSLAQARAAALWSTRLTQEDLTGPEGRTATLRVTPSAVASAASRAAALAAASDGNASTAHAGGLVGAVRVQLESALGPLALAEVQAYAVPPRTTHTFTSGSSVRGRDAPAAVLAPSGRTLLPDEAAAPTTFRRFDATDALHELWTPSASPGTRGTGTPGPAAARLGGDWLLSVRDAVQRRLEPRTLPGDDTFSPRQTSAQAASAPAPSLADPATSARPVVLAHGAGGIAGWALNATLSDGSYRILRSDSAFEVAFLPAFGALHAADVSSASSGRHGAAASNPWASEPGFGPGDAVEPDPLTARHRAECSDAACNATFGVGPLLTRDARGEARPLHEHRVTWGESDHRLVYRPRGGFAGEDSFQVRVWVGGQASPEARVSLSVRECRQVDLRAEREGRGPRGNSSREACSADIVPDVRRRGGFS